MAQLPVVARGEVTYGEDETDDEEPIPQFDQPVGVSTGGNESSSSPADAAVPPPSPDVSQQNGIHHDDPAAEMDIASAIAKKKKRTVNLAPGIPKRPPRRLPSKKAKASVPLEAEDEFGHPVPIPNAELIAETTYREASDPDFLKEEEERMRREEELKQQAMEAARKQAAESSGATSQPPEFIAKAAERIRGTSWFGSISRLVREKTTGESSTVAVSVPAEHHPDLAPDDASFAASQTGHPPTSPADFLSLKLKGLRKVAERRPPNILGNFAPSKYSTRSEQLRSQTSMKLQRELTGSDNVPQAVVPLLGLAAYDLKRDWTGRILHAAEMQLHRELLLSERLGSHAMQAQANIALSHDIVKALRDAVDAMDGAMQPLFAPSSTLAIP